MTALGATATQNFASVSCLHTRTKTVCIRALALAGLIRAFHVVVSGLYRDLCTDNQITKNSTNYEHF